MLYYFGTLLTQKLKENISSLTKLIKILNISRSGFYSMLDNPTNIKVGLFLQICEEAKIDLSEVINLGNYTLSSDAPINKEELENLIPVLNAHDLTQNDLALFLNINETQLNKKLINKNFDHKELMAICSFFKIPIELFYKNQYKTSLSGISSATYARHSQVINLTQNRIAYENRICQIKLEVIDLINDCFRNISSLKLDSKNYCELYCRNNDYNNFNISIIGDNCSVPIIFLSNNPEHPIPIQAVIEEISFAVYAKFLKSNGIKINEVIWCELTYNSKEQINICLVKSESNTKFTNTQWLTIKGLNDKNIKIEPKEVKDFLNME
jgi:transcriptional regulator with XRE-family HTH domain